jgi:hypothetical protein
VNANRRCIASRRSIGPPDITYRIYQAAVTRRNKNPGHVLTTPTLDVSIGFERTRTVFFLPVRHVTREQSAAHELSLGRPWMRNYFRLGMSTT